MDLALDLNECKSAAEINVTGKLVTNVIFQEFLSAISENSNLRKLNLSYNILSENNLERLQKSFNKYCQLEEINLSHTSFSPISIPYIIAIIKRNPQLKVINLSGNCFGEKCKRFDYFIDFTIALNDLENLTELDLSKNHLNSDKLEVILKNIASNKNLQRINLSNNQFDAYGSKIIGEFLQNNHTLLALSLAYNSDKEHRPSVFFGRQFTLLVKPIFLALKIHNRSLKKLDIQGIELNIEDLNLLKYVVAENKNLSEIIIDEIKPCKKQDINHNTHKIYEDIKGALYHNNLNDEKFSLANR